MVRRVRCDVPIAIIDRIYALCTGYGDVRRTVDIRVTCIIMGGRNRMRTSTDSISIIEVGGTIKVTDEVAYAVVGERLT
jgi:hypothetical protein